MLKVTLLVLIGVSTIALIMIVHVLVYLRRKVERLIAKEEFSMADLFSGSNKFIFHRPFKLSQTYPNDHIRKLARKYDSLVPAYYVLICLLVILCGSLIFSGEIPVQIM